MGSYAQDSKDVIMHAKLDSNPKIPVSNNRVSDCVWVIS